MPPNPWNDVASFLTHGNYLGRHPFFIAIYALLLALAALAALLALWRLPQSRNVRGISILGLRVLTGTMWWQQSLWKIPPHYDGLIYWMRQEAKHAAVPLQGRLVAEVVLPHISVFAPLVYAGEVAVAVSLILGLFSRLGAALGLLMAINLWLGLYSAPGEWPWTYFFLVMIQLYFVIEPPGRTLGFDCLRGRGGARGLAALA